ncbi:hypothetical protein HBI56_152350 [Parastagonospora nodorum]|nr:hypothetical protein HBH52_236390 [Parastagonospora nodorum]KAH3995475.1 hypothetical protein HBI10_171860 [Parastagonospora nodorum]KAH4016214.1 hypothetical protein HBI13_154900 [Parastagonospora nodorum]KAH4046965.1 hypothetical protein HBH49_175570 [Parastagonospora nodorum]KAH4063041.1 hypothetical protein HBH50_198720 [Parastagonospora nodorum]
MSIRAHALRSSSLSCSILTIYSIDTLRPIGMLQEYINELQATIKYVFRVQPRVALLAEPSYQTAPWGLYEV